MSAPAPTGIRGGGENTQHWRHREIAEAFAPLEVTDAFARADKFEQVARCWEAGVRTFDRAVGAGLAAAWSGIGANAASAAIDRYLAQARELAVALDDLPGVVRAAAEAIVSTKYAIPAVLAPPTAPVWSAGGTPARSAGSAEEAARDAMHQRYVVAFAELYQRIPLLPMPVHPCELPVGEGVHRFLAAVEASPTGTDIEVGRSKSTVSAGSAPEGTGERDGAKAELVGNSRRQGAGSDARVDLGDSGSGAAGTLAEDRAAANSDTTAESGTAAESGTEESAVATAEAGGVEGAGTASASGGAGGVARSGADAAGGAGTAAGSGAGGAEHRTHTAAASATAGASSGAPTTPSAGGAGPSVGGASMTSSSSIGGSGAPSPAYPPRVRSAAPQIHDRAGRSHRGYTGASATGADRRPTFGGRDGGPAHFGRHGPAPGSSLPGTAGSVTGRAAGSVTGDAGASAGQSATRSTDRFFHCAVAATPPAADVDSEHELPDYLITQVNTEALLGISRPTIAHGVIGG